MSSSLISNVSYAIMGTALTSVTYEAPWLMVLLEHRLCTLKGMFAAASCRNRNSAAMQSLSARPAWLSEQIFSIHKASGMQFP